MKATLAPCNRAHELEEALTREKANAMSAEDFRSWTGSVEWSIKKYSVSWTVPFSATKIADARRRVWSRRDEAYGNTLRTESATLDLTGLMLLIPFWDILSKGSWWCCETKLEVNETILGASWTWIHAQLVCRDPIYFKEWRTENKYSFLAAWTQDLSFFLGRGDRSYCDSAFFQWE